MSLSKSVSQNSIVSQELFEKVILQNDLAGLSPFEKVQHVKNVCESLGLNPLTKPFQLHKFQGKEVMYVSKDGAEQLRNIHSVSIIKLETDLLNGDLYIVKAYAKLPSGREDCSTSALSISGLKGEAIGNAMKKCETQAKRRVTLSICGLGMLDETEVDDLPKDIKYKVLNEPIKSSPTIEYDPDKLQQALLDISQCTNIDELQEVFAPIYREYIANKDKASLNALITAKDKKKNELQVTEFNKEIIDAETGEIK